MEVLVSRTNSGAVPDVAEAVKLAVGGGTGAVGAWVGAVTVIILDTRALAPIELLAVSDTV